MCGNIIEMQISITMKKEEVETVERFYCYYETIEEEDIQDQTANDLHDSYIEFCAMEEIVVNILNVELFMFALYSIIAIESIE